MMIYQGRGGMWNDWLQYQANMKQSRKNAERQKELERQNRKKKLIDGIMIGIAVTVGLSSVGFVIYIFTLIAK